MTNLIKHQLWKHTEREKKKIFLQGFLVVWDLSFSDRQRSTYIDMVWQGTFDMPIKYLTKLIADRTWLKSNVSIQTKGFDIDTRIL